MIAEGRQWQARALAEAAEGFAQAGVGATPGEVAERRLYGEAVRDVMLILSGDEEIETSRWMKEIFERYSAGL